MSDDVPPPQSEAPASDQSQAHPSDRQTTTTDTQQKLPEKAPGEQSQAHQSDRQTTTTDTQQKLPEREIGQFGGIRLEGHAEPARDHSTDNSKPGSPKDSDGQVKEQKAGKGDDPLSAGTSSHDADDKGRKAEETGHQQEQPHPSDRQATAADTQQKPSEKSPGEPSVIFNAVDKFFNPNREIEPIRAAAYDNYHKRGEALVTAITDILKHKGETLGEVAYHATHLGQEGEATKLADTLKRDAEFNGQLAAGAVVGFGELVKDTGQAAIDVGYHGAAYVDTGNKEHLREAASRATDIGLNVPDIVTAVADTGALAKDAVKGGANLAKNPAVETFLKDQQGGLRIPGTITAKELLQKIEASGNPIVVRDLSVATVERLKNEFGSGLAEGLQQKGTIAPYEALAKAVEGLRGHFQAHHIVEQQVLKYLGHDTQISPAVILTREEHEALNVKLGKELPPGEVENMTKKEILSAYEKVYKDHPLWIEEVLRYF